MKKTLYLSVILFLVLAFSFTACGGDSGSQRLSTPTSGDSASQAQTQEVPAPASMTGDAATGEKNFVSTCSACHGPKGEGIVGLGKDMTTSKFIAGQTDDELVAFIKVGRDPSDPLNTTGVAMPPKGGNPALSEQDLYDIVAHIRTLHKN